MRKIEPTKNNVRRVKRAMRGARGFIRNELKQGRSSLYETDSAEIAAILRLEGNELVIVALEGKNLKANAPEIINFAKSNGATSLRFHTRNLRRLEKGIEGLGFELIETRQSILGTENIFKLEL